MTRLLGTLLLKIIGWREVGVENLPDKCVICVAPHTSGFDLFVGLFTRMKHGFPAYFVAKQEFFKNPVSAWFFRCIGGFPIDRSGGKNMVQASADLIRAHDRFQLTVAPEGTRHFVPKWRTGFYHIARLAEVPIVMCSLDYANKRETFSKPFFPTGDEEKDMETITAFFKGVKGKVPEWGTYSMEK
jgi:1-acyl-sn-glycerol-3-phosphate acyltransferase